MVIRKLAPMGLLLLSVLPLIGAEPETSVGDQMIAEYFSQQTAHLDRECLSEIESIEDWNSRRQQYRKELFEMLGLDPLPEKSDLKATVTGTEEHDEFAVDKIHFQSRPGLYVTASLYRPLEHDGPLPAVLYVCGHGRVKKGDVSYGNKSHYQHHGAWFARNGYICLVIDTLQLGEIEGIHHGTYRYDRWWWLNHGYTPAGVEAWNCIRALDLLESREDVDAKRMGVTGRSGGGAYSWWIAALDERIGCAVPVAGITDLQNHVVDGCVEGHCDCMYMVNTYGWDYAKVAALVAPRPLLISNTDTDRIFPLDGVYRIFNDVRRIYQLHGAADKVALNITAGGHKDTQELRVHAFRWFNHHLKGEDALITKTAEKLFEPEQLQVFRSLPKDELNSSIDESFVTLSQPAVPQNEQQWTHIRNRITDALRTKCFRGWESLDRELHLKPGKSRSADGITMRSFDFKSQDAIELTLFVVHREGLDDPDLVVLNLLDDQGWTEFVETYGDPFQEVHRGGSEAQVDLEAREATLKMFKSFDWVMAYVAPRGMGPTAWNSDPKKRIQIRRRFYLLGQSLDGMRVFDGVRAAGALRNIDEFSDTQLWIAGQGKMAGIALYSSLMIPDVYRVELHGLNHSHREGPYFLNVSRFLDIPHAVAVAAERSKVVVYDHFPDAWAYPAAVGKLLGREKQFQIRKPLSDSAEKE